jgi:hypothetical protein
LSFFFFAPISLLNFALLALNSHPGRPVVNMQAEEVERWKLKIRNSSMAILKDVQKLLTCSRDGDAEKIASISSEIAANARELIDTIHEQVSDRTEAGKQVLQTMEQTKRSIVVTMKACEAISRDSTETEQNALKEECKVVAGNIKLIHQHASALKPSDFVRDESDSEDSKVASGVTSPRLKEALEKVAEHAKQAHAALAGLETASIEKDQPQLVLHAKALSAQCSELLQQARRYKFEALVRLILTFTFSSTSTYMCFIGILVYLALQSAQNFRVKPLLHAYSYSYILHIPHKCGCGAWLSFSMRTSQS